MTATKPNYGTYHRQATRRRSDATRTLVSNAFSEAWKNGTSFTITLDDDGAVRVKAGTKTIFYYEDASHFAADFMPEILT